MLLIRLEYICCLQGSADWRCSFACVGIWSSYDSHVYCQNMINRLLKVSAYFPEKQLYHIHVCLHYTVWDLLIKERICSTRSKFFPLRVDPFFRRVLSTGEQQEVTKYSKNGGKWCNDTSESIYVEPQIQENFGMEKNTL